MDASTKVMVQSAALQSRTTVPLARHFDAVSTHYRYMDADATAKDGEDRARIIRELKAKRSKTKGAGTKTAFEAALEVHGTGHRRPVKRAPPPTRPPTNQASAVESSIEQMKRDIDKRASPTAALMKKIAAFKAAQERDLAVVERLIQEKNAAEAKAKQLEALLWEQPAKVHPTPQSSRPKATKKPDLVIDAGESFFNDIHGDESAPPDFDVAGPRTASSIEDEPPGFGDIVEVPEPCASPTSAVSTKRRERHVAANPASDDDAPPSTWATRISSVHSSFLSEGTASADRKRHGSFFEAKERAQQEEAARAADARAKLERAKHATPFTGLLENEAKTRERKNQRLQKVQEAASREYQPFKARDPPVFEPTDADVAELARQKRVAERAAALLAQSQLPPRLAQAKPRKSRAAPEAHVRIKAQPVPDFQAMQTQWKASLQRAKSRRTTTQVDEFSLTRPEMTAKLAQKKQARIERLTAAERAEKEAVEAARRQRLEAAMEAAKASTKVSMTASHKLRTEAIQAKLKARHELDKSQEEALVAKKEKLKNIAKQVIAEVSDSERKRKEEKGNYVEDPEAAAKAKAEDDRKAYQEAIKRNRERILAATAARPSLMERFAIDKKKEEHKRKALQAVVANVFGKNLGAFKGVFTEDEEDLVAGLETSAADDVKEAKDAKDDEDEYKDDDDDE